MPDLPREKCPGSGVPTKQRYKIVTAIRRWLSMRFERKLVFPAILFVCNIGAVVAYVAAGDWKRAAYWAGSSICIAMVSV